MSKISDKTRLNKILSHPAMQLRVCVLVIISFLSSCGDINEEKGFPATTSVNRYAEEVAQAANHLIELTPNDQRATLVFPFTGDERTFGRDTTFTPSFCAVLAWCLPGWGLLQGDMSQKQLVAMHQMLSLALSPGGYQTLLGVINRQRIIGEMEDAADPSIVYEDSLAHPHEHARSIFEYDDRRNELKQDFWPSLGGGFASEGGGFVRWTWNPPGLKGRYQQFEEYTLAIFGEPGKGDEWGFRFEGHHITVNMTFLRDPATGRLKVHTTPLFFGAFPMIIPESPHTPEDINPEWNWEKGQMMMFSVAHHLRQFWLSVDPEFRDAAFITSDLFPQTAPLLTDTPLPWMISSLDPIVNASLIQSYPHVEVYSSDLSEESLWHLKQAFHFYTGSMNFNIAEDYLYRLQRTIDKKEVLTLSWGGHSLEDPGSHHYSYIAWGPFLLEFLQGNQFTVQHDPAVTGNHVHSMLRDLSFDWVDPMRSHHQDAHLVR